MPSGDGRRLKTGVAVVEPSSGEMLSFLMMSSKQAAWLTLDGWLDGNTLIIEDGQGQRVWLFDVTTRELRPVAVLANDGLMLDFAQVPLAQAVRPA